MKNRASLLVMFAIAAGTLLTAASGCELIASVDRNNITTGGGGSATTGTVGGGGTTVSSSTQGGGGSSTSTGTGGCDPAQCPAPSSECKVAACDDNGACIEEDVADGMDAATQIDGDCKKNVCQGGAAVSEDDNADVEDDGTLCTVDSCNAGTAVHMPDMVGLDCSDNGGTVCDGAGNCVECNADGDCNDPDKTACDVANHVCVVALCVNGMKDPGETDIDCGGPSCGQCADTKDCGEDLDCQSNNCDANKCKAGTCNDGILNNNQLGETDIDCGGSMCSPCSADLACDLNTDCKSGVCTTDKCVATCFDTEKNQDETDADCGGSCNANCDNGKTCTTAADCNSGFCNGTTCAACTVDGNCASIQYCDAANNGGTCVVDKTVGQACTTAGQCPADACVDGFCCGSASCPDCQTCGSPGEEGTCKPVGAGTTDGACTGNSSCDATGACKKNDGQTCAANAECFHGNCVDGICCNNGCTNTCKACNVAGSLGSCVNLPLGQEDTFPAATCTGANSCDGAGACKKDLGETCGASSECSNGNCVDGVCCGTASCATCQTCNGTTPGTCTNITSGQIDNNPVNACTNANTCDGLGNCKKNDGQTCSIPGDCLHGNCVDGVCCNTACAGLCKACNVTGSVGTCTNNLAGTENGDECNGNAPNGGLCDGAGACGQGATTTACQPNVANACTGNVTCPVGGVCP